MAVTKAKPVVVNSKEPKAKPVVELKDHVVEIISDSGEGAQKCAQSFATIAAKSGNSVWTVEIIPAEIQPPARSIAGASGNRIRLGSYEVTNGGDETDLAIAFNEQVILGRIQEQTLKKGCTILLEHKWRTHRDEAIVKSYLETYERLLEDGFKVIEVPMEVECLKHVSNPRRGKNMFVLGLLCSIYSFDLEKGRTQIASIFAHKGEKVIQPNIALLEAGFEWAEENLEIKYKIPPTKFSKPQVVMNGNTATGLGVMASGMEVCAMYPITPATSASHYLAEVFENVGGTVHQAEDEIAAVNFAIGSSYAGRVAVTITSGPGYSLKQEAIGLAVMGEIPLVVINVQRGGPSTGQPTKVEQGDLLSAIFGSHGDAPKIVLAPSSVEDCFYSVIAARKIAEAYKMVVVVLSDANLATAQSMFARPDFKQQWLAPPPDQTPVPEDDLPYDWHSETGLSQRFIPGQKNGMYTLTGLAHDRESRVAYDPETNMAGLRSRSLKLAAFQKTLKPPKVHGPPEGDLLIIGWGSTRGAIEEAVERANSEGLKVSSLHLKFLQPMASGIKEILQSFKKVMTVEISWSDTLGDSIIDEDNRRYTNLAWLLRARYLVDIDCWGRVDGKPMTPGAIENVIREKLNS